MSDQRVQQERARAETAEAALERARIALDEEIAKSETLQKAVDDLTVALNAAESARDRLLEREKHFAKALAVADGGQYRNDWDGAISRLIKDRNRYQEAFTALRAVAPTTAEVEGVLEDFDRKRS